MPRDIKPYKQGTLSRYCSVYAVINAVRMMGLELPVNKAQEIYDYVLDQLYVYDALNDVVQYGADGARIEQIIQFARDYLKTVYKKELTFIRPFYNNKLFFDKLLEYMQQQRQQNKAIIIRVRSENIDHYTVFDCVKGNKLKLFDSNHLPYIKVNDISHIKNDAKFQLLIRQLYVLELCNLTIPRLHTKKSVQTTSKPRLNAHL